MSIFTQMSTNNLLNSVQRFVHKIEEVHKSILRLKSETWKQVLSRGHPTEEMKDTTD